MDDDHGLKIDILDFKGNLSLDDFINWLYLIEKAFEYKGYSDEKKCKMAISKLKDYALLWWENVKKQRSKDREVRFRAWEKWKKLLKKWFLLDNHRQKLYLKLHTFKQGESSVQKYNREFEKLMMRSDALKLNEQTIAGFLRGL